MNRWRIVGILMIATALVAVTGQVQAAFVFAGPSASNVDTNPGTQVNLVIPTSVGSITDLNVSVELVGGHMEDFDLFLTSAIGTIVQLKLDATAPFSHVDDPYLVTFDDESASPFSTTFNNGTQQPFSPLSAFDGESLVAGNVWTLTILDDFAPNEGNDLLSWSISGSADSAVPEPTTLAIWGVLGGLGLIAARRRRKA